MNINPVTAGKLFKVGTIGVANTATATGSAQGEQPSANKIQDTITISRAGSSQQLFSGASKRIASEIVSQDSPARIAQLKEAIASGRYHVSSADLADAMLGRSMLDC